MPCVPKLIHFYGTGREKNAFIVLQALQRPMQNVNIVWAYLWALLQGPIAVQCSLEWKWYVQTKKRLPSSTHCCVFSSQNCKWMQPPHLVPAGSVPVPPISVSLTVGIQQKTWSANSWGWCLINMFSPLTSPPHIILPGRVASNQPRSKCEDPWHMELLCKSWHIVWLKRQFWLSLAVLHLLCNFKRCIFNHTGADTSMNISKRSAQSQANSRWNVLRI